MSIYQGGLSVSRFRIIGKHKESITKLDESFRKHRLKPFKLGQVVRKEIQYGWVQATAYKDTTEEDSDQWSLSDGQVADGFLLRMRVDRRAVPRPLLQNVFDEKIRVDEKRRKNGKIPKSERKQILSDLKDDLLGSALPNIGFIDGYWKVNSDILYVFTTGKRNLDYFEELFRKSFCKPFDVSMLRIKVPLLGISETDWVQKGLQFEDRIAQLAKLQPSLSINTEIS